jgi:DNA primase
MGRIEVELESKKGKSEGEITVPSSLDQVETAILASALETIDRVGPCRAKIEVLSVEDVRAAKKTKIIERAKELLGEIIEASKYAGVALKDTVRQAVQVEEITQFGEEKCPAGPNVESSDAIIVVEGRADVLNLLKYGIKNAIAVDGTNVPKTIQELSKEKIVTAFVDGDRGGELILRELLQVAEVDFVARAPKNKEVEELTQKQIVKALRNKIPMEQYSELAGIPEGEVVKEKEEKVAEEVAEGAGEEIPAPATEAARVEEVQEVAVEEKEGELTLTAEEMRFREVLLNLSGSLKANLLNAKYDVVKDIAVRDLAETLKKPPKEVVAVVFDGVITQRLLDIASEHNIRTIVGVKMGNVTKQPVPIEILTRSDLGI